MIFKRCPFCGNKVSYNSIENYLYCQTCLEKGIIIKITGSSKEDIFNKWNIRDFDNKFLSNVEYLREYETYLKNFGNEEVKDPSLLRDINFGIMQPRMDCCGCIITKNGKIKLALTDHETIFKEILGLSADSDLPVKVDDICESTCLIRVTFIYKYISAYIPTKINETQIDSLITFCIQNSNWCERFEILKKGDIALYTTDVNELKYLITKLKSMKI